MMIHGHTVTVTRTSADGAPSAYAVTIDGEPAGRVLTDVTRVWCAYGPGTGMLTAVSRRRDALSALVAHRYGYPHPALDEYRAQAP